MDLDEAADELYAISPDDFMARRTALAKQAKEAGEKLLAKQITALRKPTRSAWLVNLVARAEPDRLAELVELGDALQQAQQAMDGDALRRLSRDRRTMIDTLARRAGELGREEGHPPADGALQEVSQTLQAALGDPAVAELVQAGRLHQSLSYGGFGPDDLASALAASMPPATKAPAPGRARAKAAAPEASEADEPDGPDGPDEGDQDAEARAAAEQARAEADTAQAAAEEAEAAAAADELGLELREVRRVEPFPRAEQRHLHLLSKVRQTPERFPRRAGMARKRPLGRSSGA